MNKEKRAVPKAYTLRKIRELEEKYGESASNMTVEDFIGWLEKREWLADEATNKLYGR